jgi:hypothetical protein
MQLLVTLTPDPQPIAQVCKQLRMKRPDLEQVVVDNYAGLVACGVQFHRATVSEVARSIKLASLSTGLEPTYYSRISRSSHDHH